jgi:hypothetical protein
MDWFAATLTRANAASALTTLLGGQKIYAENAPQNTARPYVTLLDVTEGRPQTLTGWDLEAARVQVDVWADTYKLKNSIMEAVLTALVPGGTFSSHIFQQADIDLGPRDVAGERDGDAIVYRKTADLIIHHRA